MPPPLAQPKVEETDDALSSPRSSFISTSRPQKSFRRRKGPFYESDSDELPPASSANQLATTARMTQPNFSFDITSDTVLPSIEDRPMDSSQASLTPFEDTTGASSSDLLFGSQGVDGVLDYAAGTMASRNAFPQPQSALPSTSANVQAVHTSPDHTITGFGTHANSGTAFTPHSISMNANANPSLCSGDAEHASHDSSRLSYSGYGAPASSASPALPSNFRRSPLLSLPELVGSSHPSSRRLASHRSSRACGSIPPSHLASNGVGMSLAPSTTATSRTIDDLQTHSSQKRIDMSAASASASIHKPDVDMAVESVQRDLDTLPTSHGNPGITIESSQYDMGPSALHGIDSHPANSSPARKQPQLVDYDSSDEEEPSIPVIDISSSPLMSQRAPSNSSSTKDRNHEDLSLLRLPPHTSLSTVSNRPQIVNESSMAIDKTLDSNDAMTQSAEHSPHYAVGNNGPLDASMRPGSSTDPVIAASPLGNHINLGSGLHAGIELSPSDLLELEAGDVDVATDAGMGRDNAHVHPIQVEHGNTEPNNWSYPGDVNITGASGDLAVNSPDRGNEEPRRETNDSGIGSSSPLRTESTGYGPDIEDCPVVCFKPSEGGALFHLLVTEFELDGHRGRVPAMNVPAKQTLVNSKDFMPVARNGAGELLRSKPRPDRSTRSKTRDKSAGSKMKINSDLIAMDSEDEARPDAARPDGGSVVSRESKYNELRLCALGSGSPASLPRARPFNIFFTEGGKEALINRTLYGQSWQSPVRDTEEELLRFYEATRDGELLGHGQELFAMTDDSKPLRLGEFYDLPPLNGGSKSAEQREKMIKRARSGALPLKNARKFRDLLMEHNSELYQTPQKTILDTSQKSPGLHSSIWAAICTWLYYTRHPQNEWPWVLPCGASIKPSQPALPGLVTFCRMYLPFLAFAEKLADTPQNTGMEHAEFPQQSEEQLKAFWAGYETNIFHGEFFTPGSIRGSRNKEFEDAAEFGLLRMIDDAKWNKMLLGHPCTWPSFNFCCVKALLDPSSSRRLRVKAYVLPWQVSDHQLRYSTTHTGYKVRVDLSEAFSNEELQEANAKFEADYHDIFGAEIEKASSRLDHQPLRICTAHKVHRDMGEQCPGAAELLAYRGHWKWNAENDGHAAAASKDCSAADEAGGIDEPITDTPDARHGTSASNAQVVGAEDRAEYGSSEGAQDKEDGGVTEATGPEHGTSTDKIAQVVGEADSSGVEQDGETGTSDVDESAHATISNGSRLASQDPQNTSSQTPRNFLDARMNGNLDTGRGEVDPSPLQLVDKTSSVMESISNALPEAPSQGTSNPASPQPLTTAVKRKTSADNNGDRGLTKRHKAAQHSTTDGTAAPDSLEDSRKEFIALLEKACGKLKGDTTWRTEQHDNLVDMIESAIDSSLECTSKDHLEQQLQLAVWEIEDQVQSLASARKAFDIRRDMSSAMDLSRRMITALLGKSADMAIMNAEAHKFIKAVGPLSPDERHQQVSAKYRNLGDGNPRENLRDAYIYSVTKFCGTYHPYP